MCRTFIPFILPFVYAASLFAPSKVLDVELKNSTSEEVYCVRTAYLDVHAGKKKTLFFIHENSASKECFGNLPCSVLLENFRLIFPDLPGHGESSALPVDVTHLEQTYQDSYTYPGYAKVMNALIARLGLAPKDVTLVGWAMGGHVAIDMLAQQTDFRRVILLSTPIHSPQDLQSALAHLKEKKAGEVFNNLSLFDVWAHEGHFNQEQAQVFHGPVKEELAEIVQKAVLGTVPIARKIMMDFAFRVAPTLGDAYPGQAETFQKYRSVFALIQGREDPLGMHSWSTDNLDVDVQMIEDAGRAPFLTGLCGSFAEALVELCKSNRRSFQKEGSKAPVPLIAIDCPPAVKVATLKPANRKLSRDRKASERVMQRSTWDRGEKKAQAKISLRAEYDDFLAEVVPFTRGPGIKSADYIRLKAAYNVFHKRARRLNNPSLLETLPLFEDVTQLPPALRGFHKHPRKKEIFRFLMERCILEAEIKVWKDSKSLLSEEEVALLRPQYDSMVKQREALRTTLQLPSFDPFDLIFVGETAEGASDANVSTERAGVRPFKERVKQTRNRACCTIL